MKKQWNLPNSSLRYQVKELSYTFFSHEVYSEMIRIYFFSWLIKTAEYEKNGFRQYRTKPHNAMSVQTYLTCKFGRNFIDQDSWPPRFPDLYSYDFFQTQSIYQHRMKMNLLLRLVTVKMAKSYFVSQKCLKLQKEMTQWITI